MENIESIFEDKESTENQELQESLDTAGEVIELQAEIQDLENLLVVLDAAGDEAESIIEQLITEQQ